MTGLAWKKLIASLVLSVLVSGSAFAEIVVHDAAGRTVRLERPAERIATNESLLIMALALIDDQPVSRLAGWAAPRRIDGGYYAALKARFPEIDAVPDIGGVVPASSSAESILSVRPDLFVISRWEPGWTDIVDLAAAAGVPTVFLDGPSTDTLNPVDATAFSMQLLGTLIGRESQARAYAEFIQERYARVAQALASNEERASVLIDAHAGPDCCSSPGADNRLTEAVTLTGGQSIGGNLPGYDGRLSSEFVLGNDPKVYVATGGPHLSAFGGVVLGVGVDPADARASFRNLIESSLRGSLTAVQEHRAFAISHQLTISAMNVLMVECFAKWLHPAEAAALDPEASLREINTRFLAVPMEGALWVSLEEQVAR